MEEPPEGPQGPRGVSLEGHRQCGATTDAPLPSDKPVRARRRGSIPGDAPLSSQLATGAARGRRLLPAALLWGPGDMETGPAARAGIVRPTGQPPHRASEFLEAQQRVHQRGGPGYGDVWPCCGEW
eukprot:10514072-Alexandrium_andersonii.AAC.1